MTTPRSATPEGTARYVDRLVRDRGVAQGHFRNVEGLSVSSIGLGTYLGDADENTDVMYTEAVAEAVRDGCNVVDSAINYRFQRSERSIGAALARLFGAGDVARDEVFVTTKGGYVPFDGVAPRSAEDVRAYLAKTYFEPGICTPEDMATNGQHCMAPRFLEHELDRSLENLGLSCVDVYYIHNPEGQLAEVDRDVFDARIRAAFALLESKVADGKVVRYGTATWGGFRAQPKARDYLSLAHLVELAREVGGDDHHFRVVQLPHNLAMPEAYAFSNQACANDWVPVLRAAERLGIAVFASAALLQSRLTGAVAPELARAFGVGTAAACAIQFARSTPGITCALVGMKRTAHVRENLALARVPPAPQDVVENLFEDSDG